MARILRVPIHWKPENTVIPSFPQRPKNNRIEYINKFVTFVIKPQFSNGFKIFANMETQHLKDRFPNTLSHTPMEE
jgi:hypothetical protein